jgi:hypothetical protein
MRSLTVNIAGVALAAVGVFVATGLAQASSIDIADSATQHRKLAGVRVRSSPPAATIRRTAVHRRRRWLRQCRHRHRRHDALERSRVHERHCHVRFGSTRTTWAQIRTYLNGNCGTNFAP